MTPVPRYMRGCPLVQVPTTLMACVDSSIGGKTAVNVQQGHVQLKNVIGTFYPPARVYIDLPCIAALPPRLFANGMAEIIKCAILASPALYALLSSSSPAVIQTQPSALAHVMYPPPLPRPLLSVHVCDTCAHMRRHRHQSCSCCRGSYGGICPPAPSCA